MRNRKLSLALLVLSILLNSLSLADSLDIPSPSDNFYVYDAAEIISDELEDYIVRTNKKIYKEIGAQVVVSSVTSLDGRDIKEYARAMFEDWEIGSAGEDNGILILLAPNEDKLWIETGYGLEGALPDSIQKRIIEDEMIPYFSKGDFENGILAGFNRIISGIEAEYDIDLGDIREVSQAAEDNRPGISWKMILGIVLVIFIDMKVFNGALFYTATRSIGFGRRGGDYYGGPYRGPGNTGGRSNRNGSSGGGGRSGGGGAGGSW